MTNEERVKYIEDRLDQYCVSNGSMNDRFVMSAFAYAIRREAINEMNSQFKEYIETHKQPVFASETDDTIVGYSIDADDIINELFGETEQDNSDREE